MRKTTIISFIISILVCVTCLTFTLINDFTAIFGSGGSISGNISFDKPVYPESIAFSYSELEVNSDFTLTVMTTTADVTKKNITLTLQGNYTNLPNNKITDGVIIIPKTVTIGQSFIVQLSKSILYENGEPVIENGDYVQWVTGGVSKIVATSENNLVSPAYATISVIPPVYSSGVKYIINDSASVEFETRVYSTSKRCEYTDLQSYSQIFESSNFEYLNSLDNIEQNHSFNRVQILNLDRQPQGISDYIYCLSSNAGVDKHCDKLKLSLSFTENSLTYFVVTKITNKEKEQSLYISSPNSGENMFIPPTNCNIYKPINEIEISPNSEKYVVFALSIDKLYISINSGFILPMEITK